MEIDRNDPAATKAGSAEWFTGTVRLAEVAPPDPTGRLRTYDVRFCAGARTAWHHHPHGQLLHVTEGVGLLGRKNGPVQEIRVGDTVRIAPGEWHWHGATSTAAMRHLAVQEAAVDGTTAEWAEQVTDDEYGNDPSAHR